MTVAYLGWVAPWDNSRTFLRKMAQTANQAQVDPLTVETAHRIVRGETPRNDTGYALAIRQWLRDNFRFVPDQRDVDTTREPHYLLLELARDGKMTGDCDDLAVLGAALGLAVGLSPRFKVLEFPSLENQAGHVYAELETSSGWVDLDTTKPRGLLEQPSRILVYPV